MTIDLSPQTEELILYRGENRTLTFTFPSSVTTIISDSFSAMVRSNDDDTTVIQTWSASVTDSHTMTLTCATSGMTGLYVADVRWIKASDSSETTIVRFDPVRVIQDVTR